VEFTTRSIAEDEEALAELERIGTMTTPVTLIDGEEVVGFDRRRLRQLLGL
jgi:glutaredoxin 3